MTLPTTPKFSIVTCTWNSEPYLEQSIASVLSQDYPEIEYIFVDGGSTDGTIERIQRIPREVKFVTGIRGGISLAMNEGLRLATGDIVAHLHSDDYYLHGGVLRTVADRMRASGAQWLIGRWMEDRDGQVLPESYIVPHYSYKRLLKSNFIPHVATFVSKALFDRVGGFDPQYKYAMDYDMWLRLGAVAEPVQIDDHLPVFRSHAGSLSTANEMATLAEDFKVRMKYAGWAPHSALYHGAHYIVRRLRLAWHIRAAAKKEAH